jgi:hypothetical protein
MSVFTNQHNLGLPSALFLASDSYDYIPDVVSATSLMKPIRQQILKHRVSPENRSIDVVDLVKSRLGTAIHDSIEKAWVDPSRRELALRSLGYNAKLINRIIVNPEPEDLKPDSIPVYLERRSFKEIDGVKISGKFDFVADGAVRDFKTTGTFTWVKDTKTADYQKQLSIYRWLNQDIITSDVGSIDFFFTDWQAFKTSDPNYPQQPVMSKQITLLTLEDTEAYVREKLQDFDRYKNEDENAIPSCTPEELWQRETTWKYYKDPLAVALGKRSTKNFDNPGDANALAAKNGVGTVVEVMGEVVACKYCDAYSVCSQKDNLIAQGLLRI